MVVGEGVILTCLFDEVLDHVPLCLEEDFLDLEELHLDILWGVYFKLVTGSEKEFFVEARRSRLTDVPTDRLHALVHLLLEVWHLVIDDSQVRMANPSVDQSLV